MSAPDEPSRVERVGDTVRRPRQRWTPAVHAALRHLRAAGLVEAPLPLGVDEQGREVLEWIPGDPGPGWANVVPHSGLEAMARLLRRVHDAGRGFVLPESMTWADLEAPRSGEVICHGDFGPWNLAWRDGSPVGVFDWDLAYTGDPIDDVAYALDYVAPFRTDELAMEWLAYPGPPDRAARIRVFWAAYSGSQATPEIVEGLVDAVLARQRRTRALATRLAEEGIEPQATWLREGRERVWDEQEEWVLANRAAILAGA
ncbi:aminoglycoside phosphotransferase family protein [Planctomonas deserti]|uniref:aminoglycoside phosphotransferase family protein n=1 Tax=Planctomonas deserti TaxID=2144185 RepID=UPI000D3AD17B|nr:aminoglycoside phosphotransferase family protein [Planctomonas deserti]